MPEYHPAPKVPRPRPSLATTAAQAPAQATGTTPAATPPSLPPLETKPKTLPWWPFLLLAVPVSSFLGLLRVLLENGWGFFGKFWGANFWADLLFIAGTYGAVWTSAWIASNKGRPTGGRFTAAVAVGFLLNLVVYALSRSLAGAGLDKHLGFFAMQPGGGSSVYELVVVGLLGLVAMAFIGPLLGLFLPGSPAAKPDAP